MNALGSWLLLGGLLAALWMVVSSLGKGIDDPHGHPGSDSESRDINRCVSCGDRVLVENTYRGMCDECCLDSGVHLPVVLSPEDEWDLEREWLALQRILDDESREGEDHR